MIEVLVISTVIYVVFICVYRTRSDAAALLASSHLLTNFNRSKGLVKLVFISGWLTCKKGKKEQNKTKSVLFIGSYVWVMGFVIKLAIRHCAVIPFIVEINGDIPDARNNSSQLLVVQNSIFLSVYTHGFS